MELLRAKEAEMSARYFFLFESTSEIRLFCIILICYVEKLHFFNSEIKQKNEGGWSFRWDEESQPGHVLLEVDIARFLDSSLIDVDVHPSYISMIVKGKVCTG